MLFMIETGDGETKNNNKNASLELHFCFLWKKEGASDSVWQHADLIRASSARSWGKVEHPASECNRQTYFTTVSWQSDSL